MSVECTPPSLVSTTSFPSLLCVKLCSKSVHRSVNDLVIYRIITRPKIISYTRGIFGRAVVGCPSNEHLQVWCLSAPLHDLCLLNFASCVCIDTLKYLVIYSIISRPVPISEAGVIPWRAVVGCPLNAHLKVWCLPPPLHHFCLLKFVPCVSIDPFKI